MNMNFDVPYEDMVRGARSGSSSGRRLSSGRGSSAASASGPSSVPPPLTAGQFMPPLPTVAASFFCVSSSGSRLGLVYTSSSYSRSSAMNSSRSDEANVELDTLAGSPEHCSHHRRGR
ncbi:hypothetical protein Taro_010178 [Colocasia esculenta]|uniref:Uncharacterized protein n=1 Tax=Colocasia esculenta TaxID=4460 RepID=A0A843U2V9_COLES|nr:hypothetical protein [Colocasia esculenta]